MEAHIGVGVPSTTFERRLHIFCFRSKPDHSNKAVENVVSTRCGSVKKPGRVIAR